MQEAPFFGLCRSTGVGPAGSQPLFCPAAQLGGIRRRALFFLPSGFYLEHFYTSALSCHPYFRGEGFFHGRHPITVTAWKNSCWVRPGFFGARIEKKATRLGWDSGDCRRRFIISYHNSSSSNNRLLPTPVPPGICRLLGAEQRAQGRPYIRMAICNDAPYSIPLHRSPIPKGTNWNMEYCTAKEQATNREK